MTNKLSAEHRKDAALDAIEVGRYLTYRGATYRIDTCEIEDGEVLISDPNTGEQSTLTVEDFLTDENSVVLGLLPIFDNSEEDPRLLVAAYTRQQFDRLQESGADIMKSLSERSIMNYQPQTTQSVVGQSYIPADKSVFVELVFDPSVPEKEYASISKKLTEQLGPIFGR